MTMYLDDLNISLVRQGFAKPQAKKSVSENPIEINGKQFERGIGTHAWSEIVVALNKSAKTFTAEVGITDDAPGVGVAEFICIVDQKVAWKSSNKTKGEGAGQVSLDLTDAEELILLCTDADVTMDFCHCAWADAKLELKDGNARSKIGIKSLDTGECDIATIDIDQEDYSEIFANKQRPPMGWNSWNVWGEEITQEAILEAGKHLIQSGLSKAGYEYINIDDGWAGERDQDGKIKPNERFPDMKGLVTSLHEMGLKVGTYSSPGKKTCAGYTGSFGREKEDAEFYAACDFDFLKYDYCSYNLEVKTEAPQSEHKLPYQRMSEALKKVEQETGKRIELSLCTAGWFQPWEWGKELDALMWRTTSDVFDTWGSVTSFLSRHDEIAEFQQPGHYNDPDMLVVGKLGWAKDQRNSQLTHAEQVSHITLWAMLSAPLLIGCNLAELDDFTKNLLTNPEVLAIDQDSLGQSARLIIKDNFVYAWSKKLSNGDSAISIMNRGPVTEEFSLNFSKLNLSKPEKIRDCWKRKYIKSEAETLELSLKPHNSVLLRLSEF